MREFLDYWEARINGSSGAAAAAYAPQAPLLYMKDWHLCRAHADGGLPYETPEPFRDDWLNAYWDSIGTDDYRFCYMGPAGTARL